jgi:hypothetical protein
MRIPKFKEEIYKQIKAHEGDVPVIYSMYLTSYKLNFPINAFAVRGSNLIGYTEFKSCNTHACEEHIKDIFNQNGIKNITIKIFNNEKNFTERLDQLQNLEEGKRENEMLTLLGDISL